MNTMMHIVEHLLPTHVKVVWVWVWVGWVWVGVGGKRGEGQHRCIT
jgi:hypothetical protein